MARYDVYPGLDGRGFLLDVQSDILDGLNTRIVVPLLPENSAPAPAARLNPVFPLGDGPHVMITQFLSPVPVKHLGTPVANLVRHDTEISTALDMLFTGF